MEKEPFYKSTNFIAVICCFLWATAFVGIKIGLRYSQPLQFAGIRFFISGCLLLAFIPKAKFSLKVIKENAKLIVLVGFLQTTLVYSLFYTGLSFVPASLGAMLVGSGPLFAAIVAHIFIKNDKLTTRKTAVILLGFSGIVIISLGKGFDTSANHLIWLGIILLLINNIVGGLANVVVSQRSAKISAILLSSLSLIFGGFLLILISFILETWELHNYPIEYYLSLAWLSFLSATAITLWFVLLKRPGVKVSNLNIWKFIIPVLGAILSWLIMPNESPDATSIIGMIIIGISLLLLNSHWVKNPVKK
ncbi:DMT family transporter [Weeksellaceae bacterium TAE3-ERU29]|nr:DMT family transporter [Weeksellaceae bacterium TAE3-ERU29]